MKDIESIWCNKCGNNFLMKKDLYENLEECGNTFYCPKGHALVISRTSIVSHSRFLARSLSYRSERIRTLEKREASLRGVQARQRNRLLRGVCPYCGENAFVTDLVGHIKDHHKRKTR